MKMIEYGREHQDVIILLHGGGLSWWNYRDTAELLKARFHVVIPVLDGHAESDRPFSSIESNAQEIIAYIDERWNGQVLLMGGLSLGGQILLEILSQRKDICRYAMVESALVRPMKLTKALIGPSFSLCYPLVKKRWFSRLQFKYLRIKDSLFEAYFADTAKITQEDMTAFLRANTDYSLSPSLADCTARTLVLVGEKEQAVMKKSAEQIAKTLRNAQLETLPGLYHGELSINHAGQYVEKLLRLMGLSQE